MNETFFLDFAASLACALLTGLALSFVCIGLSALNRAFPSAAGFLSRLERKRFAKAISECWRAFMILGFSIGFLNTFILAALTIGPDVMRTPALLMLAVSLFGVVWLGLLVRRRIAQMKAFILKVRRREENR